MPTDGRTRSLRLASVALLAGIASASVCLGIVAARARADPLVAAAGDIACDTSSEFFNGGVGMEGHCRQKNTSDLLVQASPTAVLTLGDNQYHVGSLSDFTASFDPTWGRLKPIIHPAVGNHEYAHGRRPWLLRLLQRPRQAKRPCRRARQGLLQLRHRRLAPDRTELGVRPHRPGDGRERVRDRVAPGELFARRSRCSSDRVHARVLAQPAVQLRPAWEPPRDGRLLGGAS